MTNAIIPVIIEASKNSQYGFGADVTVFPAHWGQALLQNNEELQFDIFLLSDKSFKYGEKAVVRVDGFYRVIDKDSEDPWFILICRELIESQKLSIESREAQLLDVYRFVYSNYKVIATGNDKAAAEILKYCKVKKL